MEGTPIDEDNSNVRDASVIISLSTICTNESMVFYTLTIEQ